MKSHGMMEWQKQAGQHSFTWVSMCCGICVLPQQFQKRLLVLWYNPLQTTLVQKHIKSCGQLHLSHIAINNCHNRIVQKELCFSHTFFLHNPLGFPVSDFTDHWSTLTSPRLHVRTMLLWQQRWVAEGLWCQFDHLGHLHSAVVAYTWLVLSGGW